MSVTRRKSFLESQEGQDARQTLQQMTLDSSYNTVATYTADGLTYPDNLMPFVDKHINYLIAHPNLEVRAYVANVRLKSRLR